NLLRTIPEILWALIFVFMVGLGPFPGLLALAFHTGGVLGKLFGEVLEDVDPRPVEALQSTGASRLHILFYGILPPGRPPVPVLPVVPLGGQYPRRGGVGLCRRRRSGPAHPRDHQPVPRARAPNAGSDDLRTCDAGGCAECLSEEATDLG